MNDEDDRPAYPDGKLKEFSDEYFDEVIESVDDSKPVKQTYEQYVRERLETEEKLK